MEVMQDLFNSVAGAAFNGRGVSSMFDWERENSNSFFTNITLLSMVLSSIAGTGSRLLGKEAFKKAYDYIIVGGGTAGSVMANRLSENPCISVLLLEAGGEPPLLTDIPSFARLFYGSKIDWLYKTAPQKYGAYGHKENRVNWNNGKVLGGSSLLNAMLYVRGNMRNYDEWAKGGATGWSYDEVLPYFLKLEDNRNIEEFEAGDHRTGGLQTAEKPNYVPEIKNPLLEATKALGYELRDINGKRQTGIYDLQATTRNHQRCSTAKSYLEPASDRPNLDILTNAFARKILIRKRDGVNEAYGVEFDHLNKTRTVLANREVIISNGAIRTPQILMLSGIGPRDQLKKLKIPVVVDLPVGKNLQDHCATNLVYTIDESIVPVIAKNLNPMNMLNYIINRRGPLTSPNQVILMAFLDGLNTTRYSRDFPRQEIYFCEYDAQDAKANLNLKGEVFEQVYAPYIGKPLYICYSSLLQPYSRGEITLNSTDPYDMPIIDPRYYEDERDLWDIFEGMKVCQAVAKHPAMRQVKAKLIETQRTGFPNCEEFEGNEDQYFTCLARHVINTFWHFAGTAKMGNPEDPTSVVDPQLRVIGVDNLRVISAAVMPIVVSGNTNVPTMMIAEKAYDMMKGDIKCENEVKK